MTKKYLYQNYQFLTQNQIVKYPGSMAIRLVGVSSKSRIQHEYCHCLLCMRYLPRTISEINIPTPRIA